MSSTTTTAGLDIRDYGWVETWLDEHPEFFQSYLLRKGTRAMIDSWLVAHALPAGVNSVVLHDVSEELEGAEAPRTSNGSGAEPSGSIAIPNSKQFSGSGSKCSSGSGTPVRKISAHEFERGGLTKPLINNIDGTPTFLSPTISPEVTGQIRKRSRNDVLGLNETDLIFELVKDICNDLDIRSLCHKILQNVGILTSADR